MRNYDAEQRVLVHAIRYQERMVDLVQVVGVRYFTSPDTIAVWQILQKLFLDGSPINEITVRDRLPRGLSIDWAFADSDVYKADVYISILKDNYLRRSLAAAMERGVKQVGDPQVSPSIVRDDLQRTILDLALDDAGHRDTSLKTALRSAMAQARDNAAIMSERGMIGLDLCSSRVNWLTAGARRKELTILGGLTGMGKSLYMNAMVDRNSRVLRKRGLVISLEMSAEAICFRLIGTAFGVSAKRLATGFMRRQEPNTFGRSFFSLPRWQRGQCVSLFTNFIEGVCMLHHPAINTTSKFRLENLCKRSMVTATCWPTIQEIWRRASRQRKREFLTRRHLQSRSTEAKKTRQSRQESRNSSRSTK